jgi:ATP-dependent DNA helicase DinG
MTDLPMAGEAPPAADWTAQDGGDIPKILQDCSSCEAWVDVAFGEGGLFAQAFEGYEPRPGQIQLAKTFARAFETGKNAMAEGPTGTGKSFAYLVPAIYMAIKHHMPVVIATPVISLQEQLAEKDLPTLRRVLPFKFKFALFKGRGNFLCQKRFNEWHETWQNRSMSLFGEDEDDHPRQRQKTSRFASEAELINWAEVTQTGDKSEMRPEAADELWGEVCGSSDDCKCPKKGGCYYRTHKDEAEAAHVVVTNYHMLFTHLQLKLLLGVDALLGPLSIVVLDEAHEAADLARKFFGFELKASAVKRQSRMLDRAGAGALAAQLLTTFTQLTEIAVTKARQKRSGLVLSPSFGGTTTKELEQSLQRLLREAEAKWDDLAQEQQTAKLRAETDAKYGRAQAGAVKVAERLKKGYTRNATRCTTIRETLRQIQDVSPDPYNGKPWVYWLDQYDERAKPDQLTLNGQPIDVANYLHMTLYTWADSVVFTSATLTTGEADRFGYARGELGFQGEEVAVDSPFNYREQGILVIPDKKAMPAGPNDPAFQDQCARLMRQAIELARAARSACSRRTRT